MGNCSKGCQALGARAVMNGAALHGEKEPSKIAEALRHSTMGLHALLGKVLHGGLLHVHLATCTRGEGHYQCLGAASF